jgi:quercetin dioxygenase-like cupin family protein
MKIAIVTLAALACFAAAAETESKELRRELLPPPFDQREARMLELTIPPGPGSAPHRHPGIVMGYVLEGVFKFGINGETPRLLKAGEVFYEAPNTLHSVSASGLADRPVKILVFYVGNAGSEITLPAR